MKISAGLLMYRRVSAQAQFLLVHPGGPFWQNKDAGAWTIPKGELQPREDALEAAMREFEEELGIRPKGDFRELPSIKQKSGKTVHAWAFEGNCDPAQVKSNSFSMEWPPRSGKMASFPEVDRAAFFDFAEARVKINPAQIPWLEEVVRWVADA